MPQYTPEHLAAIVACFDVESPIGPIEPLGQGLINLSYRVRTGPGDWVLQRVNPEVFPDPRRIMGNLQLLAECGAAATRLGLRLPWPARGRDGVHWFEEADGSLWRLMEFIPNTRTLTRLETAQQANEVGALLGRFHRFAAALPGGRLQVSLPWFHHTPTYLVQHLAARASAGVVGECEPDALEDCFARVDARRGLAQVLEDARARGAICVRVIHGDPKLDNILFDAQGHRALALIDLDTVQPGLIQQDLGDCLRSCCNRLGESPHGPSRPVFDLDLCEGILDGYGLETRGLLAPGDLAVLYDSMRLLPFELGLRFLTDHLEGDRYFRVDYRGQNLEKARVQLDLVADIESKEAAIRGIIAGALSP